MELTAASLWVLLISASANNALTMSYIDWFQLLAAVEDSNVYLTWQSSKDPSTERLCTFSSSTVVIWASCTGLTFPLGYKMKTDTSFFPLNPYIAADPVSPLVAPITVKWCRSFPFFPSFRLTRKYSNKFPRNCNATSLNANVGPLLSEHIIKG